MPNNIRKSVHINAPIEQVWAALTDPKAIGAWMADTGVKSARRTGGKYVYFGGSTTGQYTEYAKPTRLAYTWRQQEWPPEWANSVVTWRLRADQTGTKVELSHTRFPNEAERDGHDQGWDEYWLGPMKTWLEG